MADFYRSISDALNQTNSYPMKRATVVDTVAGTTTTATTATGKNTIRWGTRYYTIPTLPSGVTPYLVKSESVIAINAEVLTGLRFKLGTLTGSAGTWTSSALAAMPTRTIYGGSSQQLAAPRLMLCVRSSLVGAPTVTVTYTAQDGSTGNTVAQTMVSAASVSSAFDLAPDFASGKYAVKEVTAISGSGGTSGTIDVYAVIPINQQVGTGSGGLQYQYNAIQNVLPRVPLIAGDEIGFWYTQTATPSGALVAAHHLYFAGNS